MVSAEGNSPKTLAWLAKLERSERVLRYVAECGKKYEPENAFWDEVIALLPEFPPLFDGALPHPTRFIAMTGFIPGVGRRFVTEWQRPQGKRIAA